MESETNVFCSRGDYHGYVTRRNLCRGDTGFTRSRGYAAGILDCNKIYLIVTNGAARDTWPNVSFIPRLRPDWSMSPSRGSSTLNNARRRMVKREHNGETRLSGGLLTGSVQFRSRHSREYLKTNTPRLRNEVHVQEFGNLVLQSGSVGLEQL